MRTKPLVLLLTLCLLITTTPPPLAAQTGAAPRVVVAIPGPAGDQLATRLQAALVQLAPEADVIRYTGPVSTPQAAKRIGLHFGAAVIVWEVSEFPEIWQVTTEWAGAPQPLQTGQLPVPAGDARAMAAALLTLTGQALSRMGDCIQAVPQFDRAESIAAPGWTGLQEVRYFRGICHTFAGDFAAALTDFEAANQIGTPSWAVSYAAAWVHANQGDYATALEELDHAITLLPDNAALYADRAAFAMQLGDNAAALADTSRALEISPADPVLLLSRARMLTLEGDYAAALSDLDTALAGEPFNRDELLFQRGLVQLYRGDLEAAVRDLSAYTSRRPEDAAGWINLGQAHEGLGQTFSAIQAYETALLDDPAATHLYTMLARLYYEGVAAFAPESKQASDYLTLSENAATAALEAYPGDLTALLYRGLVRLARNQNEAALEDLSRAVDLNPDFAAARYNRAIVYTRLGYNALDAGEKDGLLRAALTDYAALFGLDFAAYSYLLPYAGYLYADLGDYDAAAEHFAAYDELYPDQPQDPTGALYRGLTYRALGETEPALEAFRIALSSPDQGTVCAARLASGRLEAQSAGRYAIGADHLAAYLAEGCAANPFAEFVLQRQVEGWRALAGD